MAFRVGQKVVCVDDVAGPNGGGMCHAHGVFKGNTYTVTSILDGVEQTCLGFAEATGNWHATRFRPLVERKTDISSLVALLHPKKVQERV